MKKKYAGLFGAVVLCFWVSQSRGGDERIFRGEISDTQCALNVHAFSQSHKEMRGMKPELKDGTECARYCVKQLGGRYVLQTKDKVYKLNPEFAAEEWAGAKVKIVGTLDPKTNVLTVLSAEPLAGAPPNNPAKN